MLYGANGMHKLVIMPDLLMQKLEVTGILEIIKPVLLVCTDLCHKNRLLESLNSKYPFKYWSLIKVHYGICAIGWYSIQLYGKCHFRQS